MCKAGASTAFVLLGAASVARDALGFSRLWIIGPGLAAAAAYLAMTAGPRAGRWRRWGIRTDNARGAWWAYGAPTVGLGAAMLVWALAQGRPIPRRALALLLALYPAWAFAQQLCFQVVLREALDVLRAPAALRIAVLAAMFSAVHAPDPTLMALTLAAGAYWAWQYGRVPNLVAVSLSHGILGSLVYVCVLGRDPLSGK